MIRNAMLLLPLASMAAASGQVLFKIGAQDRIQPADFINVPIMVGLVLYGLGTVLWIYALAQEKLVVVYAFSVLTFALVYLGSVLCLGETLTLKACCGVALVLAGLFVLTSA